jgi:hypothetical protein
MGGKIPKTIRKRVIMQWLYGFSRDQIAKDNQIGAGTVSAIIKQCKLEGQQKKEYAADDDFEFDLIRQVAVVLKREGLNVNSFASSIRLQRKLEQKGLNEEQIESFVENMYVECFKRDLKSEEFIDIINKICIISEQLGIPVGEMPEYMIQEQERLKEVREEIIYLERTKIQVLRNHNVTINTLQEYERNKPLADNLVAMKKELEKVKNEKHSYKIDLEHERLWKRKEEENRWLIPVAELDKANRELGHSTNSSLVRKIEPGYLKNMVMDVYYYPSKYVDVIRQMMNTYNLENNKKNNIRAVR